MSADKPCYMSPEAKFHADSEFLGFKFTQCDPKPQYTKKLF